MMNANLQCLEKCLMFTNGFNSVLRDNNSFLRYKISFFYSTKYIFCSTKPYILGYMTTKS